MLSFLVPILYALWHPVVHLAKLAYGTVKRVFVGPAPAAERANAASAAHRSRFAAAASFVLRIVKRDRPVVYPQWSMCPST
jgi:hypothetical protein